MATVASPADQATDLLQNLTLDSQTATTNKASEVTKKPSPASFQPSDRTATTGSQEYYDPSSMYYYQNGYPYYYGNAYDGSVGEWDYSSPDGQAVYGDMYHYSYAPYGAYSPAGSAIPTFGHDGQLYGPQQYQYPHSYYQSPTPPTGTNAPTQVSTTQGEVTTSVAADQAPSSVEKANGTAKSPVNVNGNGSLPRPSPSSLPLNSNGSNGKGSFSGGVPPTGYQDARYSYDGVHSPVPWVDGSIYSGGQYGQATSSAPTSGPLSGRNQNHHPLPNFMGYQLPRPTSGIGSSPGFRYPNNKFYGQYGSTARGAPGYSYGSYDSRSRMFMPFDNKYNKPKGRGNGCFGYGNENMDGFNEMNRGPRARPFKNQKGTGPVTLAVKGQNLLSNVNSSNVAEEKGSLSVIPDREQFNREEFPEKYTDAKFFIIKSYSEDDIHKSIKYSVWASTPNGNKKLDAGYREAQEKPEGCPVFLMFSVNTSGQFVGLAEMVGPVNFDKSVEYWQQDKWNGCFPVKWHIVKDIPNSLLKHIHLENNDNKPVTNSRDTQEVKLEQGLQILKIFKDHSSKTCILDDFGFYEARQKTVQEKKAKQQQFQKQVWEGKPTDTVSDEKEKEGTNPTLKEQNPSEVASDVLKEPLKPRVNGECRESEQSELVGGGKGAPNSELVGGGKGSPNSELVAGAKDAPNGELVRAKCTLNGELVGGVKGTPNGELVGGAKGTPNGELVGGAEGTPKCELVGGGAEGTPTGELVGGAKDALKSVKAILTEKQIVANGVANGCS